MQTFVDNAGRTWSVTITPSVLKRIQRDTGFALHTALDGEPLQRFYHDPLLVCEVAYAACRPQAEVDKVTQEAFEAAVDGDILLKARDALLLSLATFLPQARRTLLLNAYHKLVQAEGRALAWAEERINAIPLPLDASLDKALEEPLDGPPRAA